MSRRLRVVPAALRASELIDRRAVLRWHLAILTCIRRMGIDKGLTPDVVELDLEARHLETIHLASGRVFGEPIPIVSLQRSDGVVLGLEVDELRRLALWFAKRVKSDDAARLDWYPEGWRAELAWIHGREPAHPRDEGRESGADEHEDPAP